MDRRSFLGALCAAPVAVPAVAKSLASDTGETAVAQYVDSLDPMVGGTRYAVRLDKRGYVAGLTQGERIAVIADEFRVVAPAEGPIPAFKLAEDRIVPNPEFPWGQFFGG